MRKCSKCKAEMIEVKPNIKITLLILVIELLLIFVIGGFSMNNSNFKIICIVISAIIGLESIVRFIAILVDGVVRYECTQCKSTKQKISLFRTFVSFIGEITSQ